MDNKYKTGEYWETTKAFHEEDSDFKFKNFMILIKRNPKVIIEGVVDFGCGAGRMIFNFSELNKNVKCLGVDLSEKMISYATRKYTNENLSFQTGVEMIYGNKLYNTIFLADVFEHVEDYTGLLREINQNFMYQIFNIPLDLSVRSLLENGPVKTRKRDGHLHHFYDKLAFKILEENGFKIIDFLYADNISLAYSQKKGIPKILYLLKIGFTKISIAIFGISKTATLFGGFSLTVLCSSNAKP